MSTAELALTLSVLLAAWELWKYLLEGGRVRVTLRPGFLDEYWLRTGRTWSEVETAWGDGGWPVEVAVVEVENLGRTAVTISDVAFDFGRAPRWRVWRNGRRGIKPWPVKAPQSETETTRRLEPFDRARFVYDVWGALRPYRESNRPEFPLRLRVSVRVAGKRRRRLSSWCSGWPVKPGQLYFLERGNEIGLAAYRAMWRQTEGPDSLARAACIPAALAIRKEFPASGSAPNKDEIQTAMVANYFGDAPHQLLLASLYVSKDLEPYFAEPIDETAMRASTEPFFGGTPPTQPAKKRPRR